MAAFGGKKCYPPESISRRNYPCGNGPQSLSAFDQDVAGGRWQRPSYDVAAIEQKTEELSASHALAFGCRTLDIIHVAAALAVSAKDFVTFDFRQAALGREVGLIVKP